MENSITYILDLMLKYGTLIVTIIVGVWARHKFNKQHNFNKDVELLKSQLMQNQAILNSAINSFASERQASQERRLIAIENIWKAVLLIRKRFSSITFFYSILLPAEYNDELKKHRIINLDEIKENLMLSHEVNLEEYRPFISEKLWMLFFTYKSFQNRIAVKFVMDGEKGKLCDWREDSPAITQLSNVLDVDEVNYTKNCKPFESLTVAINFIEYKILEEMNLLLSGAKVVENNYKNATKLAAAINANMQENQNTYRI